MEAGFPQIQSHMQNEFLQMVGQKSFIGNKHPDFNTVTGFEKSRFPLTILNI